MQADECGNELKFTGLDDATKKILLDKHNELRQKVASGGEAGQPGAANMKKLVWDDELATIAQRWTDQCIFEHDKLRDLCDGTFSGQNAWQSGTDYEYYDYDVNPEIGQAVQSWYDEVTSPGFDAANINPFVYDICNKQPEIFYKRYFSDMAMATVTTLPWCGLIRTGWVVAGFTSRLGTTFASSCSSSITRTLMVGTNTW